MSCQASALGPARKVQDTPAGAKAPALRYGCDNPALATTREKDPAMLLDADESQLVLVDYQARFDAQPSTMARPFWPTPALLARVARTLGVPVGTEQNPSRLGPTMPTCALLRPHAGKMHFSAAEEGLGEWLRPPAKPQQGGNARSLPKHLQNQRNRPQSAAHDCDCRMRSPCLPVANSAGPDGRRV